MSCMVSWPKAELDKHISVNLDEYAKHTMHNEMINVIDIWLFYNFWECAPRWR